MQLLTCLGVSFNQPTVQLGSAKRIVVEGGAGCIHGVWHGPEMHVGGWAAVTEAQKANQPDPPIDVEAAQKYFAKLSPFETFISNFYELRFDERSVDEVAKVLRAARGGGLKAIGHYGFPAMRFGMPVTTWQSQNDAVARRLKPYLTLINPSLYIPDELCVPEKPVKVLPLNLIYEYLALLAEASRLAGKTEEVVPVISDRSVSGNLKAPPELVSQVVKIVDALSIKRVIYWSDHYEPDTGDVVLKTVESAASVS